MMLFVSISAVGQNFTFSKTFSEFSSFAISEVAYDDIPIQNQTNQVLNLKWIKVSDSSPSAWDVRIEDPDSFYAVGVDTGYFSLDTVPGFSDLLGCYFFPKGVPGLGIVVMDVVQVDDSTQRGTISWQYRARDTTQSTSIDKAPFVKRMVWYENGQFFASSEHPGDILSVFDLSGKALKQIVFEPHHQKVPFYLSENSLIYVWNNAEDGYIHGGKLISP